MERAVALKKLGKILGKGFGYRVDPKAPDQDARNEARAKLGEATTKRDALDKQMQARRLAILQADVEYQQLRSEWDVARKYCQQLGGITLRYRFTAGTTMGNMFFCVRAQGDSWEEVIAKLTKKEAA